MKRMIAIILTLLLLITGCSKAVEGQQVIEEFLGLKSQLYEHQEEVVKLAETMTVDGELERGSDGILLDIKSKIDGDAFDRLLGNRMIIDESLLYGNYDKSEIKNLNFKSIKSDGGESIVLVTYDEILSQDGVECEIIHQETEYTLVKREGEWKIFDIKPIKSL